MSKKLGPSEAMALSLALMAPTLSASLNGAGVAGLAGKSVALVMVMTTVGVALVAYAFVVLTRAYNHAGSVYALAGTTLGPRSGFFAGFALLGVYLAFSGSTLTGTNVFAEAFLSSIGATIDGTVLWILISVVAAGLGLWLATKEIRAIARSLLVIEAFSVALILVLSVIILIKAGGGGDVLGSRKQGAITGAPFSVGSVGFSGLAAACVLGFFSFAGFEASASLGEETNNPRKYIPLALGLSVLLGGLLFVFTFWVQGIGFGTDAAGVKAFASSSTPIGDLAEFYVGKPMAVLLDLGALLSAFGALLGCVAAAGRLLFALSRDGIGPRRFASINPRTQAPTAAIAAAVAFGLIGLLVLHGPLGVSLGDSYFYFGTVGSLSLLVAYAMTSIGAIRFVLRRAVGASAVSVAALTLGIGFIAYVLYKSVVPVPDFPANLFPYIVVAWLLVAVAIVVRSPGLARRIGERLAATEGFEAMQERQKDR